MNNYEQKYKEALERSKKIHNEQKAQPFDVMLKVFPELKEDSEDEKIRKALIEYFTTSDNNSYYAVCGIDTKKILAWLEKQGDKDKLIQEFGEYKVKYTQEVLEKHLKTINKDDERLRKTTIAFLKDFADKGYENAVECIDWLEKQGEKSISFTFDDILALQCCMETVKKVQEDKDLYNELLLLHNKVHDAYTITKKNKLL